jgi:monofunctional biosynthetic peptidoglycan transglycosylase
VRKGLEAVYTFIIEKVWSKDIILERYLNSIEMGQGVFGVEAAAQYYFGKSSKDQCLRCSLDCRCIAQSKKI